MKFRPGSIILLIAVMGFLSCASSGDSGKFDREDQGEFRRIVRLPGSFSEDADKGDSFDLVIGLHRYGGTPDVFSYYYDRFENPDFIFAALQGPYYVNLKKVKGYSWSNPETRGLEKFLVEQKKVLEYIAEATADLQGSYNINKTYIMGFSQGGGAAYEAGITNHELYDGIITIGARLYPEFIDRNALVKGKHLRIFIAHASDDSLADFEEAVTSSDLLRRNGYDVFFYMYEGGHVITDDTLDAISAWIKGEPVDNGNMDNEENTNGDENPETGGD